MIILLSPAKSLKTSKKNIDHAKKPQFLSETGKLIDIMKQKSKAEIGDLMKISDSLAALNYNRYQKFQVTHDIQNSQTTIDSFDGDVYKGLQAEDWTPEEVKFADQHLRILSGLYGILRPLDLIQPYRLEMGTKLPNPYGANLYKFWGKKITESINNELADSSLPVVINLASNEYFKAIHKKELNGKLINVHFKEYRDDKLRVIAFSAKRARGMMANYIVKNQIHNPEEIKGFAEDRYTFSASNSDEHNWMFIR